MSKNGFTLIEVMVALSVVAIGLMACLKAINQELSQATVLQNKVIASWVLENKIAELRLATKSPPLGIQQGKETMFKQTWQWQTKTEPTAEKKIHKITIAVMQNNDPLVQESIYLRL